MVAEYAPNEKPRLIALGAMAAMAGVLAAVVMAATANVFLKLSPVIAVMLGLVLGALVISLDSLLLASPRRQDTVRTTALLLAPRVMLATIEGLVVGQLAVLLVFSNEINGYAETHGTRRPVGLLDALGALDRLTAGNPTLSVACWALVVFVVVLVASPPIIQGLSLFGVASAYDRLQMVYLSTAEEELLADVHFRMAQNDRRRRLAEEARAANIGTIGSQSASRWPEGSGSADVE